MPFVAVIAQSERRNIRRIRMQNGSKKVRIITLAIVDTPAAMMKVLFKPVCENGLTQDLTIHLRNVPNNWLYSLTFITILENMQALNAERL